MYPGIGIIGLIATIAAAGPLPGVPWPATDGLGRSLPMAGEPGVPAPRPDRFVGMFYFLWHDDPKVKKAGEVGPYDIAKILARQPDALRHPESPLWGAMGVYHYWAEPLYGYYLSTDRWVLRRHAQLLGAAGIDVLIFDATNVETYPASYRALCSVFEEVRRSGGRTPGIAFMVNTRAAETAERIDRELYRPGLFRDLWFRWEGKPLLLCDPAEAGPEIRSRFTLRRAHWPDRRINTPYAWHWEADYPQHYGYTDDPKRPEQVSVSVAQNLQISDGLPTNMSEGKARGRAFHDGAMDASPVAVDRGPNFQEQWRRALSLDPPFVLVTGWNEWIAGRWGKPEGPIVFVDQFDRSYSRDIEPMKGGHGDNYYYQLVANVRRYKGIPPIPTPSAPRTIRIDGEMGQWSDVRPSYADDPGDTAPRDSDGAAGLHYRDRSGRNDLVELKVARDAANLYFYARTRQPLSPTSDPGWMLLLIDIDADPKTGWEGYDFLVDRGAGRLSKNAGGWRWEPVGTVSSRVSGAELHLAIPHASLGLTRDRARLAFDFKWLDNPGRPGDVMDFYTSGDVAPEGRFSFRYVAE